MANIVLTSYCVADCNGSATINAAYQFQVTQFGITKTYFCDFSQIVLEYDSAANYFAIGINSANAYKYAQGDTYNNVITVDAFDMYNNILNAITI